MRRWAGCDIELQGTKGGTFRGEGKSIFDFSSEPSGTINSININGQVTYLSTSVSLPSAFLVGYVNVVNIYFTQNFPRSRSLVPSTCLTSCKSLMPQSFLRSYEPKRMSADLDALLRNREQQVYNATRYRSLHGRCLDDHSRCQLSCQIPIHARWRNRRPQRKTNAVVVARRDIATYCEFSSP